MIHAGIRKEDEEEHFSRNTFVPAMRDGKQSIEQWDYIKWHWNHQCIDSPFIFTRLYLLQLRCALDVHCQHAKLRLWKFNFQPDVRRGTHFSSLFVINGDVRASVPYSLTHTFLWSVFFFCSVIVSVHWAWTLSGAGQQRNERQLYFSVHSFSHLRNAPQCLPLCALIHAIVIIIISHLSSPILRAYR